MLNLKNRSIVRTGTTAKRGTGKVKTHWVCYDYGYTAGQWWGTCPSCNMVGTMKELHEAKASDAVDSSKLRSGLSVSEDAMRTWLPQRADQLQPVKLSEVNSGFNEKGWRFPLSGSFGDEVSIVLGSGLVPGSLNLVSGDPGVGKSTLLLQVPRIDKRVHALAKLGYKTCVVPKQAVKALGTEGLENIKIVGCKNLKEFINVVFSR